MATRNVLIDFKFVFDYGVDPPENVETAIDVVNKVTHIMGSDQVNNNSKNNNGNININNRNGGYRHEEKSRKHWLVPSSFCLQLLETEKVMACSSRCA